jgi:Mg-chelatase subunit ChlD
MFMVDTQVLDQKINSKKILLLKLLQHMFSATQNNDKIGLILFSDQIELYIPPKKAVSYYASFENWLNFNLKAVKQILLKP